MVPHNTVPVIHRKFVVEIMITLSHGQQSGEQIVAGGMPIVKGSLAEPMG